VTEAWPLQWPVGKPRTEFPGTSKFGSRSIEQAVVILRKQVELLCGGSVVISTNIKLRLDGLPYAKQSQPTDKGVAVYFSHKKRPMCFACDRWDKIQDNIYAVAMTIEALRGIDRWGGGTMMEEAFTGFVALPSNSPWDVLGLKPGSNREEIEAAYRAKAKKAHPDAGGSHEQMARLNAARAELLGRSV
jgi:hypothetical protein